MAYDVIGDVHGNVDKLGCLLRILGYRMSKGAWKHSDRTAIFVGDFIDRGPSQVATYRLVRAMIDAGSALAVMGNHELNAMAYYTENGAGGYLREHSKKNENQHRAFLDEVRDDPELYSEIIDWFFELPLWLDLPQLRVVHACWDDKLMQEIEPLLTNGCKLPREGLRRATQGTNNSHLADGKARQNDPLFRGIETLLKGVEIDLPDGVSYLDKDGHERWNVRMRWWENRPGTFQDLGLMPADQRHLLPRDQVPSGVLPGYTSDRPLFLGHYWMTKSPALLAPNIACVDYSAGKDGPLTAYRWSGEQPLTNDNFFASGAS